MLTDLLHIIIALLLAAVVYYYGINRILGLPPGPPPLPLIGNMLSFQWDLDRVLLEWKERYGRIFTVWLPFPMVVIGDYELLQKHLVKDGDVFLDKRNAEQLNEIMLGGPYGLVFEDNSMVKEQRKFALKSLHEVGFDSAALGDVVHHAATEVVNRWWKSEGKTVDITGNIMKAISNVVWRLIFGEEVEFDSEMVTKFRQLEQLALPLMGGPFMMFIEYVPALRKLDFLFGNQIKRLQAIMDESNTMVKEAIERTKKSFNPNADQPRCYIEAFLREMKKNEDGGRPMGECIINYVLSNSLFHKIVTFFPGNFHSQQMQMSGATLWRAGVETTVGTLRLCCLELINHPDVQLKLQKEIDDVIGERRIRLDDQKVLPYTCAFLQEIYRIGHVLPISFLRQTTQDTVIDGLPIATGTTVLPQFSMVHFDPKEFERPDYFCPERHIDNGQFVKDPRITPFSIGKRNCLGEPLARMEIFIMFATFVQKCHFSPVGKVPPPVTFATNFGRFVHPFTVKIEPRN
ncbi:hypothetical protein PENTCL1PPCAC_19989 [Pristionchus entomophagus]|uniref:Cytochrome P450 n=1 Tax=Pristionchus entomophagus TaxID=358040 RepID=A0AAV5TTN3_9BILA|nr:hypothetical protein PENTCL1PPCAC_19989 [Pristionchus entomophagus]